MTTQTENQHYVELRHIEKYYGSYHAARDINISIERGKLVALLGPSGSGKTTILRMIAGLETPDSGDIIIDGRVVNDVPGSERGIGFVFQNYALFRYMTVYDNIAFGLKVKKVGKAETDARVRELIRLIGCEGLEKRYPSQLSGGQRQRVAFARALAPNPSLLLLDEPFAAIDAKVRQELRTWLRNMINMLGITSIFVTHDQDEAVEVADEIIVTNSGRIEQVGSQQEIYRNPQTPFVAQFIGNSAVVEDFRGFRGFEFPEQAEKAVVRPEFLDAFKPDNPKYQPLIPAAEEGVVRDVIFRGSYFELKIETCGTVLSVQRSPERRPVQVGERMYVLLHRMYVCDSRRAYLLKNRLLEQMDTDALA